jgi:predicted MPP superfamily phosphohydrolase
MRSRDIIIFFTVVFIIYSGANALIYFKLADALRGIIDTNLYTVLFIVISLAFIAGKILERNSSSLVSDILNIVGGFWLSFMFYSVIIIIATDILRVVFALTNITSPETAAGFQQVSYLFSFAIALLLVTAGFLNTLIPVTRKYMIDIDKPAGIKEFKIAAVSDIHLGSIIRKRSMRILSGILEAISPDMVLFLGDTVDGEINPVLRNDLLGSLTLPHSAKYIFGIPGNHEYIGNQSKTIPYINNQGIRLLIDEVITLEEGIQLAGRKDRDSSRFTGKSRKDLDDLLKETDKTKPVIVMDHQPPLKKEEDPSGFDLMLSGHTHNGQMWPLNYLTARIYKLIYGHRVINGRHYIVSSGYGSWGPRVRLGSRSEVLDITVRFAT